jgi:glutaredoxin
MRSYKKRTEPAREVEYFEKMVCDFCKKETFNDDNWPSKDYNKNEVTIEFKEGYCYPEGSNYTIYSVDMCPECFQTKFAKWAKEQGASFTETDVNW